MAVRASFTSPTKAARTASYGPSVVDSAIGSPLYTADQSCKGAGLSLAPRIIRELQNSEHALRRAPQRKLIEKTDAKPLRARARAA
jgi:hypothetical protein